MRKPNWVMVLLAARAPVTGPIGPGNPMGSFGTVAPIPTYYGLAQHYARMAVGPGGQVMCVMQVGVGGNSVAWSRNMNGLASPSFTQITNIQAIGIGFHYPLPAQTNRTINVGADVAWDRSGGPHNGRIYAVYTDLGSNGTNDTENCLVYSDTDGATWSSRLQVSDEGTGMSKFWPALARDQTTGNVAIRWYDARNDPNNIKVQYFADVSQDGGIRFRGNIALTPGQSQWPPLYWAGLSQTEYVGFLDYTGLVYLNGILYAVWSDNSDLPTGGYSNPDPGQQFLDIYMSKLAY